jgi:lipopolysaccharide transport system permease protein
VAIETFRYGFLGRGTFTEIDLIYGTATTAFLLFIGLIIFNKYGNKLQDVL